MNPRTTAQNRLLWGVVYRDAASYLSDRLELVVTPEQAHEMMKRKFLSDAADPVTGEVVKLKKPRSTTTLTTVEFTRYVEQIESLIGSQPANARRASC